MPLGDIKRAVASALGKNVSSFNVFSGMKRTRETREMKMNSYRRISEKRKRKTR